MFSGFWRRSWWLETLTRHPSCQWVPGLITIYCWTVPALCLLVGGRRWCTENTPGFVWQNCQQSQFFKRLLPPKDLVLRCKEPYPCWMLPCSNGPCFGGLGDSWTNDWDPTDSPISRGEKKQQQQQKQCYLNHNCLPWGWNLWKCSHEHLDSKSELGALV